MTALGASHYVHPARNRHASEVICLLCFWFHQKPKAVQTVKLPLHHRAEALEGRYAAFVHRKDQTAHISLQLPAISKSVETKVTECALTCLARPASSISVISCVSLMVAFAAAPSGAPLVHLCAAGEGVFTNRAPGPQGVFFRKMRFFVTPRNP